MNNFSLETKQIKTIDEKNYLVSMKDSGIYKKEDLVFSELLKEFKEELGDEIGAIGSFVGIVRRDGKKGGKVKKLHYECSEDAKDELVEIAADFERSVEGISKVSIFHIVDDLGPAEDIVYVLVGGEHREEVFDVLPEIMDRVKDEVKIWKKEITEEEDYWVHEVD